MADRKRAVEANEEGIRLVREGDFDAAQARFEEAVAADPSYALAHANLGNIYYERGEPERAAASYSAGLELEPAHVEALWGRMTARRRLRRFAAAQADLEAFTAAGGSDALGVGDLARSNLAELKLLQRIAGFRPSAAVPQPEQARLFNERAAALLRDGRPLEAGAYCLSAIAADPREPSAYANRAGVLKLLGDLEGAEADWDTAMSLGLREPAAFVQRGWVRKERGRLSEALEDFDAALAAAPALPAALYAKGVVFNALGRIDEAVLLYDAALEADPRLTDAYAARALARAASGRPRDGAADLEKYLELGDGRALGAARARSLLEAMRRG